MTDPRLLGVSGLAKSFDPRTFSPIRTVWIDPKPINPAFVKRSSK